MIPFCIHKEVGKELKIIFQFLFVKGYALQVQEKILEMVHVPQNRLPVEFPARYTYGIIQSRMSFRLKLQQVFKHRMI